MIPETVSDDDRRFLCVVAGRMLLHNASGFERRVVWPLTQFPMKLLLLVRAPADVFCIVRRRVAEEIIGTDDKELEINAKKIKHRFGKSLQIAATDGVLPSRLFWLVKGIGIMMKSDVRENERLNKMQGLVAERCPSASVELQSSRLQLKYLLGESGEGAGHAASHRWSQFRPVAEKVRQLCLQSWEGLIDVQSEPTRFAPSTKATDCVAPTRALYLNSVMNPHVHCHSVSHAWAASYNMIVHRTLLERKQSETALGSLFPTVISIATRLKGERSSTFRFFVSAELVRRKHRLLEVQWDRASNRIQWSCLKGFKALLILIKEEFDRVRQGHVIAIMHAEVKSFGTLDGSVNCATLGKVQNIVKLEPPCTNLIEKCGHEAKDAHEKSSHTDIPKSAPPKSASVSSEGQEVQQMGLNLLVQEAELDEQNGEHEHENIEQGDAVEDDFQHYLAKGLDTCQIQYEDDEMLSNLAERKFKGQTSEDLVNSYEKAVAIQTIEKTGIDSVEQQAAIEHVQQSSMIDPLGAVFEVALATAQGVDSVSEEARAKLSVDTGETQTGFLHCIWFVGLFGLF